ncbi:MAG TPA: amino acid adenylation domain-containing protein [Ktedonobacteraceae bacterium]|nr:amino acid adenylation domain-containing protein [Ktedonobacteraceae bacterium]
MVCQVHHAEDEQWQHITYAELDQRANQLAHYLHRCGVEPEVRVGLCMERSPDLLIGLLGILKAGGAYVPLDPGYPQERLAFMLADAQGDSSGNDQPLLLLTQRKLLARLPALQASHIQAICLNDIWTTIERERTEAPAVRIFPGNAAYIIYTSGSTGVPKGVIVTQQSLLHHCVTVGRRYGLEAGDRVLQFASISFDVALEEILPSWLRGATVVLWPEPIAPSPADFTRFVVAEQLTVLNLPSSYWHEWVAELARPRTPQAQRPASIRLMIVGSEKVSPAHFVAWRNIMGHRATWLNAYGLTETTITTLVYEPENESVAEQMASVPVGTPLASMQVYVLDAQQQPVPAGMPGELYIGGAGLARGYLHRPELTAERFVPHPFSERPGALLYRTGDLVRVQQDSVSSAPGRAYLEFLGRTDTQVKVRGFRVELGEIEALLSKHAAVNDVVVLAREDSPGDSRLVAYIVPAQRSPFLVAQLRTYLQGKLPAYMMPTAFVLLDTFPRGPSGKINRRALPAPERLHIRADEEYIAPRTPVEEMLAVIWAAVLHLERVSRTDNFFKLGGHSLQGTQVVARLREVLQIELPVRAIYDAPTIAALAVTVEKVRQSKQGSAIPPLRPVERTDMLPLSYAQQRLWFLDQLQPGSPFYTMSNAFIISGPLHVAALEQSLNDLVKRHGILRTTFPVVDEQPVQRIAPTLSLPLLVVDLSELGRGTAQEIEVQRIAREVTRFPFDLQRGPLLRLVLVRLAANVHMLVLTLHHMIADGWSGDIFFSELDAFYTAHTGGQPVMLPELPLQYVDYAVWQRQWLPAIRQSDEKQGQSEILETQLAYWREQLRGAPTQLELPCDHPRPAVQTLRGTHVAFALPASLSRQLQTLSQEEGVTLFMLLLAAFQVLLARYSGQTDIVVGTPVAGRVRRETEGLIGLFLNTLALRTDLSGEISFRELLGRVREVSLGAYMHQDVPFEKLVEELQPERTMSQSPLFQVFFVLQNIQPGRVKLSDLRLEPIGVSSETAKFDLAMELVATPAGLEGVVEYNTDLFEATTIERMIGHYETLLQSIVSNIAQPVITLPLLTPSERQVLQEWNETGRLYPQHHLLHALFEAQVERSPDSVAVVFEGEQMSYRELNERANRLAHFLQKLGTGPDMAVGICLERSLELAVGMLGVLKAGAAYVPLDPEYPQERLAWMLADAQASVILTHRQCHIIVSTYQGQAMVIDLNEQWPEIAAESGKKPSSATRAENLAYVIYTSGSTGQPKGVMISHRAICNRLLWMQEDFLPFAGTDRVLQKTPFSFDASVVEFYAPLLAGACLILARPKGHQESSYLLETIASEHITILHLVPTLLRNMLEEPDIEQCSCLQRVNCGGEELPADLQARFFSTLSAKLYNFYGPTECAVDSSVWACEPESQRQRIPVGLPIANMQMYILGPQLQLMPVGVPGELYIGGVGLARGYRNRPDLTAEAFMPHPFSNVPGERLYKTGDLARCLADGAIEFLRRVDFQTKLRGFRIELQEIEAALGAHPGVRENVVVREDILGDQRLVAYIVPKAEYAPSPAELRGSLRERLPVYMIPSIYVTMQQLPLTTSGKVDRSALPVPDYGGDITGSHSDDSGGRAELRPYEEVLAGIWADILRSGRPGTEQNFFDLGGHSLLATRMIARVRRVFQVDVPLRAVFEAPTVAELAAWIESARNGAAKEVLTPPLVPCSRERLLPLSYAQERLWFLSQLEPENPAYNIPFALRVRGLLNLDALKESLNILAQRHEALRTTFAVHDGIPCQVVAPPLPLKLQVIDLSHLAVQEREQEVQRRTTKEALQPFDLDGAALWRSMLLHLDADEHILLFTVHHSIADAWSLDILLNELSVIYSATIAGTSFTLPEVPLQYADYAVWQREWLQGEALEQQVAYWREQLLHAPTVLDLPADHPRPAVQSYRGNVCAFALPPTLNHELQALSRQESVTLFMTLLAALQVLLLRYSGQEDIVVGIPVAGRTRDEMAGVVGNFVNTLALRADLSGNPSFRELLARVRDVCLEAYARQDVPFEKVVEVVQPERSLSHQPLFQVMLLLQHEQAGGLALPGLDLEPLVFDNPTTKFDLTVEFVETSAGLQGAVEYNTDIFERETIERLVRHFQQLLLGIVANPDQHLSALPLMSEEEEHHLLVEWNATATDDISPLCVHQLFAQQAARNPGAVALTYRSEQLTYAQLNHRSNQLARVLHKLGVQPERVVGLFMERSLEMVAGVLGILKAGGAYVPLDPIYPAERLAFMLRETQAAVVLTQQHMLQKLPPYDGQVLCLDSLDSLDGLDSDRESSADEDAVGLDCAVTAANLAYVIYTSGSTGLPKGVMVTHGGLSNYLRWCIQAYCVEQGSGSLLHSSLASDLTVTSLFAPLLAGRCLEVLPEEEGIDALGNALRQSQGLSMVKVTPAHLTLLVGQLAREDVSGRTHAFIIGGEALLPEHVAFWRANASETRLINEYGPTETVVGCCVYEVGLDDDYAGRSVVPIGRPIANTQLYLLDAELQPVPVGLHGELYIAGSGVARGYLNRPDLTAERFLPCPFSDEPGARCYRTGDVARYLLDGTIEFLGRNDSQLKLRGYRIEPGEIEAVLKGYPDVQEAVVMLEERDMAMHDAHNGSAGSGQEKRLVAYLVGQHDTTLSFAEVRAYLHQRLPDYMIPASCVQLDALPLLPNGKVDRRSLATLGRTLMSPDARAGEGEPRNAVEEALVAIWKQVLGRAHVGIFENFFDLGGHSLLITQVISRVRESLQVELPLRTLFEKPTIADFAGAIIQQELEQADSDELLQLLAEIEEFSL